MQQLPEDLYNEVSRRWPVFCCAYVLLETAFLNSPEPESLPYPTSWPTIGLGKKLKTEVWSASTASILVYSSGVRHEQSWTKSWNIMDFSWTILCHQAVASKPEKVPEELLGPGSPWSWSPWLQVSPSRLVPITCRICAYKIFLIYINYDIMI